MLIKLNNPKLLSDVIAIISELVTEVRIKLERSGMSIVAIDPANVALVAFRLPFSVFSQFEVEEDLLGVNLDSLKSVLRRCGAGSSLIMERQENKLRLIIQDKIRRVFELALIDVETEEKTMPSLEFANKVELSSLDFYEAIQDCVIVADSCSFAIENEKFVIDAKGSLNSARSEFSTDEAKISGTAGKSKYSLEYMQKFAKASKLTEKVTINFSQDYPLKLDFKTSDLELNFVLAPRVESED